MACIFLTDEDKRQIMAEIKKMSGGTVTDEQIAAAVERYLEEHPIEGGAEVTAISIIDALGFYPADERSVAYLGEQMQDLTMYVSEVQNEINDKQPKGDYALKSEIPFVTPQMYGAKADGKTDDTKAIQAALDASSYVYIPDGTYMVNAVKSSGGILYPRSNQTIVLSDKAVLKAFTTSSSAHIIFLLENVENVHIRGGKVQGERSAYETHAGEQGYGIYLSGGVNVTIEQMEIFDFRGDGIMVRYYGENSENSKDVTISNCVIHDCNRQGISICGAIDVVVRDCEIYNIDGEAPMSGIDIEPEGGVGVCKNISIENCHIHDTTQASIILAGVDTEPIENIRIHACTLGNINAQKGEGIFISDTVFGVIYVFVGTYVQANNCIGQQVMIYSGNGYFSNCQFANTTQNSVVGFAHDNMPIGISEQVTFAHCRFVANENATHLLRFSSHGEYFDKYESYQEKVVEFVDCSIELSTSGGFAQRLPGKELRMFNTKIHCKQTKLTEFFLANNKFPCKVTMNGCSVTSEGTIACLATFNSAVAYTFNLADNVFPDFSKLFLCNTAQRGTVRLFNNVLNTMEIKGEHDLTFIGIPTKTSELSNDSGYLTAIPSEYVTDSELTAKGYLTQHQDLSGYAKTSQLPTKTSQLTNDSGYLTGIPSEYVTETELTAKGYLTAVPSEFVTDTELNAKGYLTQHQDLSGYAKTSQLPTKTSQLSNDSGFLTAVPTEYVTETELSAKGYLTAVPAEYVTDTELNAKGYLTLSTLPKYDGGVS